MIIELKFDTNSKEAMLMKDGVEVSFNHLECYYDKEDDKHRLTVVNREEDKENGLYMHNVTYASHDDNLIKAIQAKLRRK